LESPSTWIRKSKRKKININLLLQKVFLSQKFLLKYSFVFGGIVLLKESRQIFGTEIDTIMIIMVRVNRFPHKEKAGTFPGR